MQNFDNRLWDSAFERGEDFRLITSEDLSKLLERVDPALAKTCLDIGCGTGQLTRELYHRGYQCLGVDSSNAAVKIARSLTTAQGLDYMHFDIEEDDLKKISYRTYSLITCKLVYAFIKDKPKLLQRVKALLNPSGIFAVITPLVEDVPEEKTNIAVDSSQTLAELKTVFDNVDIYKSHDVTYFVCR